MTSGARWSRILLTVVTLAAGVITCRGQSTGAGSGQIANPPIPKGAVHLVVESDADTKKIFTYFPYPRAPDWQKPGVGYPRPPETGAYRIEVTPQGTVSAVTILKSMNRTMDVISMKTFVRWRAKAGPFRVVDVTWTLRTRYLGSNIPVH